MKKIFVIISVFLTFLDSATADNETLRNRIKIGMLLVQSGQYAASGSDNQQGIAVAKAELDNADQLELIFADSKSEQTHAVSEFRKLLSIDKVAGIYVFRGQAGMAVNPLSKKSKLPLLGGVGNENFALGNEYAFQLWTRSDVEGAFLAEHTEQQGLKSVALISVQDDWMIAVSKGFREKKKELGGLIPLDEELLPSDTDFRSQLLKLRRIKADAIFLNVSYAQIGPFVKQLRELGINLPVFSNFWAGKNEAILAGGPAIEGVMFVEMLSNFPHLKNELKERFNSSPSAATISAYVATMLLGQAARGIRNSNSQELYEQLLAQREVRTRSGIFPIKDRFVQFPMVLRVVKNGAVEELTGQTKPH